MFSVKFFLGFKEPCSHTNPWSVQRIVKVCSFRCQEQPSTIDGFCLKHATHDVRTITLIIQFFSTLLRHEIFQINLLPQTVMSIFGLFLTGMWNIYMSQIQCTLNWDVKESILTSNNTLHSCGTVPKKSTKTSLHVTLLWLHNKVPTNGFVIVQKLQKKAHKCMTHKGKIYYLEVPLSKLSRSQIRFISVRKTYFYVSPKMPLEKRNKLDYS